MRRTRFFPIRKSAKRTTNSALKAFDLEQELLAVAEVACPALPQEEGALGQDLCSEILSNCSGHSSALVLILSGLLTWNLPLAVDGNKA